MSTKLIKHTKTPARFLFLLVILISFLVPRIGYTHPHYWVEVGFKFEFNTQGQLKAIEQEWQFDEFVSAILLDDMDTVVPGYPPMTVLANESQRMVADLAPFNYYSHLSVNQKKIKIPAPSSHYLKITEASLPENASPRPPVKLLSLVMRFEMSKPIELNGNDLEIKVYDPTYYSAFNYSPVDSILLSKASNLQCKKAINLPSPDASMMAYAFSLDQGQLDTQGLGEHFAETLKISCQTSGTPNQ